MQVEIRIDEDCKEPRLIVVTDRMTDRLNAVIRQLTEEQPSVLAGFRDGAAEVIEQETINRVYSSQGKVFAGTDSGEYTLRLRLYEAEQRLVGGDFVRISNSEIINLKKVKSFDLSFSGTICVTLLDGTVTYVSRRCVGGIKRLLGI